MHCAARTTTSTAIITRIHVNVQNSDNDMCGNKMN